MTFASTYSVASSLLPSSNWYGGLHGLAKASSEQSVDHIAGLANIHKDMSKVCLHLVALDVKYDGVHHDYMDNKRMLHSVQTQRRLRRRGG